MLPYKLTFVSEVNHKNHDDEDLGLEHPEEPNSEMKDFDVEHRIVVSVNSSFKTPPVKEDSDSDGWSGLDMDVEQIVNRRRVPSETDSEIPPQFIQLGETPKAGQLRFKDHHSYNATILTVTSANNFYMTLQRWRALKKKTEMVVDAFYKTLTNTCPDFGTTNHELLKPGLIVACHHEGLWRRAEILFACAPVKKNGVFQEFVYKVLFIDEGEEVQVNQSQLRYLTKNFLDHRRRVQKCSLFNPCGIWNPAAVARFNEIVVPESDVTLKVLRKHEEIWDVSIKMNLRSNSKFDSRNVDIGRALATFQRRGRITVMHKPPLDSGHDADDEDSDSAPKQVKNLEKASSSACTNNSSSETLSSMDTPSTS